MECRGQMFVSSKIPVDSGFYRPAVVKVVLLGDLRKGSQRSGWEVKVSFEKFVEPMRQKDRAVAEEDRAVAEAGLNQR